MSFFRPPRLYALLVCQFLLIPTSIVGVGLAQQAPQQPKPPNPFESVPQAPKESKPEAAPAKQQQPRFETPKPVGEAPKSDAVQDIVEAIEFRGSRRVPQETLRAIIFSKKGDQYDRGRSAPRLHGALEHRPL